MKLTRPISRSIAITCLALLAPLFVGSWSLNAQVADNTTATSTTDSAAAQQEALQMVPAHASLVKTLDARKSPSGTQFEAAVDGTVHLKDGTKLPHGTILVGTVATDQRQTGGRSTLALRFTEAKLKDGETLPIRAMIARIAGPAEDDGYTAGSDDLLPWSRHICQVDEFSPVHGVNLHSSITARDSAVLVSTKRGDVKLAAGSRLSLAIAAQDDRFRNLAAGGN